MISVIIPSYNVGRYLSRCLKSLFDQSYQRFDLVVVDDGSDDNTAKILDEFAAKDARIHVVHKKNSGVSNTRNAGLDWAAVHSDSEWITFVDSDDWVHPKYLEVLYRAAADSGLEISSCNSQRVREYVMAENVSTEYTIESSEDVYTQFGKRGRDYIYARLYRKKLYDGIRYPGGKLFEDVATTYKLLLSVDKIAYIQAPLYYYFYNENGIVHQKWSPNRMDEFEAYEEQLDDLSRRPEFCMTYRVIQRDYLQEISYSYYKLQQSDFAGKEYYLGVLSGKMRAALKKYGKCAGINIKDNTNYYEIARMKRAALYWKYQALKRKLLKR